MTLQGQGAGSQTTCDFGAQSSIQSDATSFELMDSTPRERANFVAESFDDTFNYASFMWNPNDIWAGQSPSYDMEGSRNGNCDSQPSMMVRERCIP